MDTDEPEVVEVLEVSNKKPRRKWSTKEEDALMKCMLSELSDKWKAQNGFKTGFFTALEKELKKVLPGTNLKANPHIDSKVKYWKKVWAKIVDIVGLSGFGWDDVNKRISVEKSVWDEYEKAHPGKANGMYGKTFPYFDDWQILFGNDRATGEGAEGIARTAVPMAEPVTVNETFLSSNDFYTPDFVEDFLNFGTQTPTTPTATPSTYAPLTSTPHSSMPTSTPGASMPQPNVGAKKGKKRTRMGDEELSIYASMENWMKNSQDLMEKMIDKMGHEKDLSGRRMAIQLELAKLDITLDQKFKLSAVVCEEEQMIDNFYGTKPEERQLYVEAILRGVVHGHIY